ncbi:uncharacterized protein js [Drosophila tropicalis]|uniref:uncharacterized protein js n=1 Tax=Drosophila tropicalis TaxID=46794 RepID=UPI0035AB826F
MPPKAATTITTTQSLNTKYIRLLALALFWSTLFLVSEGQVGSSTNAPRPIAKTSFSCAGRPSGYYADVETGCQVYHMCDGLGRQFTYTCPNTTLFQQRMLVCDHWYMVNCSKAESNYAANLLIGQRDKPFVNDEENNLRTPRPDLLDRPYAPDYSGESFRSQYKQLTPNQNQIRDDSYKGSGKLEGQSTQTRWRIPPPSRTILPPAYEPQIENVLPSTTAKPRAIITTRSTTTTTTRSTTTQRPIKRTEALLTRKPFDLSDTTDLGTSHSTRYNTSADFNSAESPSKNVTTKLNKFVKPPSKIYEPPFLYPIYNQDQDENQVLITSTGSPFTRRDSVFASSTTTTSRPISKPTTLAGVPFSFASSSHPTASSTVRVAQAKIENRTPAPAQSFRLVTSATPTTAPPPAAAGQLPFNDLLPPFVDFVPHDIATTQGPPIYYEWKVPSNGLEPPKMDPPIGVDGREYPETTGDYNSAANPRLNDIASHNQPPLPVSKSSSTRRLPSSRSIKPNELQTVQSTTAAQRRSDVLVFSSTDITQLRKQLLIPEYAFPLENIGRTGYGPGSSNSGDLYNSFQLKIPERRFGLAATGSASTSSRWFGENPKCPECHPSFVLPGTCEPCLQR